LEGSRFSNYLTREFFIAAGGKKEGRCSAGWRSKKTLIRETRRYEKVGRAPPLPAFPEMFLLFSFL